MRLLAALLLVSVVASGCQTRSGVPPPANAAAPPLSAGEAPQAVSAALSNPDAVVLDVRTPREWAEGHVAGARLADVTDAGFASTIADLDRSKTYYVYCRSGNRSAQAVEQMRAAGFTQLYDVGGYATLVAGGVPSAR